MTRTELFNAFNGSISQTAITTEWPLGHPDPGPEVEWAVVGKFCRVTPLAKGKWDVWITDPKDLAAGLSQRKVGAMLQQIGDRLDPDHAPHPVGAPECRLQWHFLRGDAPEGSRQSTAEAWSQQFDTADVLACLDILGIRRKRQMSAEQRNAAAARLAQARNVA